MKSQFSFSVATPKTKGEMSNTPELWLTVTKDKIRLNGALTRKLLLQSGDRLMFITNEQAVLEAVAAGQISQEDAKDAIVYAIAKSVPQVNAKGQVETAVKRMSKEEQELFEAGQLECQVDAKGRPIEVAFHGFKLASTTNTPGYGQILEGSDATHWPALGGNEDKHRVFILTDEVEAEVSGQTVTAYVLEFDREEAKLERTRSNASGASKTSNEDEEEEMA